MEKCTKELEEKIKMLIQGRSCLEAEAVEWQELNTNHDKVDRKVERGNKLLQLVQSNALMVQDLCFLLN